MYICMYIQDKHDAKYYKIYKHDNLQVLKTFHES